MLQPVDEKRQSPRYHQKFNPPGETGDTGSRPLKSDGTARGVRGLRRIQRGREKHDHQAAIGDTPANRREDLRAWHEPGRRPDSVNEADWRSLRPADGVVVGSPGYYQL